MFAWVVEMLTTTSTSRAASWAKISENGVAAGGERAGLGDAASRAAGLGAATAGGAAGLGAAVTGGRGRLGDAAAGGEGRLGDAAGRAAGLGAAAGSGAARLGVAVISPSVNNTARIAPWRPNHFTEPYSSRC